MSVTALMVRHVTYRLWAWRDGRGSLFQFMAELRRQPTEADLQAGQRRRLSAILRHAYGTVPFYRTWFDRAGLRPSEFGDPSALQKLPLLSKEIIRENLSQLCSTRYRPHQLYPDSTGGSTGLPLRFFRDRECIVRRKAQELFFDQWMGYRLGDRTALFVAPVHLPQTLDGWKARIRNATAERLLAFDPYAISDAYLGDFAARYNSYKPHLVRCFPNSLVIFAEFLRRRGITPWRPRAVSCTGENLYPDQRALFAEVFQCPVFEKYGTFECGVIACECRAHQGMHVFVDGVVVEVLVNGRPASPGQVGRIVVTDLYNYGMPLIRYDIGDLASWGSGPCACGSPLPRLERVWGRDRDILVAQDGSPRPGYVLVEMVRKLNLSSQFQIIQETPDRLHVRYAPVRELPGGALDAVSAAFRSQLGEGVQIRFERVPEIPRAPSGKFVYVQSLISPFQMAKTGSPHEIPLAR